MPDSAPPSVRTALALDTWLLRLCEADTTSGREDNGLEPLRDLLVSLGAEIVTQEVAPGRTNILALWGSPRVLFTTHLDTVPPFFAPRLTEETVHGRGACDAKGQIVAQLEAIRRLLSDGRGEVAWLGVVGEESDSSGARAAAPLAAHLRDCRVVINGEPTGLKLASGQRGVLRLRLTCTGEAAHSSTGLGTNAIWLLVDWLTALRELPLARDPELGDEGWNLGEIGGGDAPNVVPDRATAEILLRYVPGSVFLERARESAPPAGRVDVVLDEPPHLFAAVPGFEREAVPFGSDAPALAGLARDRTVVLVGPGDIGVAHTAGERMALADLERGVRLNLELALHFLDHRA